MRSLEDSPSFRELSSEVERALPRSSWRLARRSLSNCSQRASSTPRENERYTVDELRVRRVKRLISQVFFDLNGQMRSIFVQDKEASKVRVLGEGEFPDDVKVYYWWENRERTKM